jgi:site-specific DNA recombinase
LASSGDATEPCPVPRLANRHDPIFKDARLQPFLDQADYAQVIDPVLQETDQPSLVDRVKECPDIRIEK